MLNMQRIAVRFLWVFVAVSLAAFPAFGAEPAPAAPAPAAAPAPKPAPPPILKVGDKVEGLTSVDMEGKPVKLDDLLKPNALNVIAFTNSACYACTSEAEVLSGLKAKHGDKINLIGVVVDINPNAYKTLPDGVKSSFLFMHDKYFKFTSRFGVDSTPATALVKGGKIVDLRTGYKPAESAAFIAFIEERM